MPRARKSLSEVADGLAAVAEVGGDPGGRPAGVGEGEHLDAVADLGRQGLASQGRGVRSRVASSRWMRIMQEL